MPLARAVRRPLARLVALLPLVALGATLACSENSNHAADPLRASGGPSGDGYTIQVFNGGTAPLSGVSILTGEGVPPVQVSRLEAGQRTEFHRIGVLHENPLIVATVAGQRRTYHPVEGFVPGFNPLLDPGTYVITLRWNAEAEFLETVVAAAKD